MLIFANTRSFVDPLEYPPPPRLYIFEKLSTPHLLWAPRIYGSLEYLLHICRYYYVYGWVSLQISIRSANAKEHVSSHELRLELRIPHGSTALSKTENAVVAPTPRLTDPLPRYS